MRVIIVFFMRDKIVRVKKSDTKLNGRKRMMEAKGRQSDQTGSKRGASFGL
jgi:hypothetical protein